MRRSINVLCLSATALVLLPAGAVAQQKTLKEQIQVKSKDLGHLRRATVQPQTARKAPTVLTIQKVS